jgi:RHS repeat-associated protein
VPNRSSSIHLHRVAVVALTLAVALVPLHARAQTVAAGSSHTVVLKPDGTVWTFGNNANGELGDNTNTSRRTPVQVSVLSDVIAVAAGAYHSLALTSSGTVYAWGDNNYGQLGDQTTTDRKMPVAVSLSNVAAIAAGEYHSLALLNTGELYVWGRNGNGQLGIGSTTNASSPQFAQSGVAAIGAGLSHSVIVKSDGTGWATGLNANGQLGIGNTSQQTSFVQMNGVSGASKIAGGSYHSVVLLANGSVKAAGYNGFGQVGDGSWQQRTSPVAVSNLTDVVAIVANYDQALVLKSDGTVRAWGANGSGQLGDGSNTSRPVPVQLTALSSIAAIGAGHFHGVAVSATGVVYTWGSNNAGQLGDGTTAARSTPGAISAAGYDWNVATPVLSLASATYNAVQTVSISVETPGATIHYTQNGNEPTQADPTIASGSSLSVTSSQTLKAKAWKSLMPESNTASATYTLKVSTPSLSPYPTTYSSPQSLTMSSWTTGVTLRYTTDGSMPTESSAEYSGPIPVATTTRIRVIGFKSGWSNSDMVTGDYTMRFGTVAAPVIAPAAGTYESSVTVELSSSQPGATILYSTNGAVPSVPYTGPFALASTKTVRAKATHADYYDSVEATRTFTIAVAAPTFTPVAGAYTAGQTVSVTSGTPGATIRYTINGLDPVESDPIIASGGTLVLGNYTLKAKAWKLEAVASAVTAATFEITGDIATPLIAGGEAHSLALRADGLVWGWGANGYGQVGDGTTITPRLQPRMVAGVTGAVAVAAGNEFSIILRHNGTAVGFGSNQNGRLGIGGTTNTPWPTTLSGLTTAIAIDAGDTHAVALEAAGTVVAWGANGWGQIGDGTTLQRDTPTAVASLSAIAAVSAGWSFTLARAQSGAVYAWGYNGNGRLGNGSTTYSATPLTVSGIATATAVAAGHHHALAALSDGSVKAWGANNASQLGDGTITDRLTPVTVPNLTGVIAVAGGQSHSLALKSDGTVWAFGSNQFGQLGDGTQILRSSPVQVSGPTNVVRIAAGQHHSLALDADAVIWVWGRNSQGQLGDGKTIDRLVPYAISGPGLDWRVATPVISLAAGTYNAPQTATITLSDPEATIRYTTDGTDPTETSTAIVSGGTVSIDRSRTLKAIGVKPDRLPSAIATAVYLLQPATPLISPGTDRYTAAQDVTITSSSAGVSIRYTTDGSEPTTTSPLYTAPVAVATLTTLRARAFRDFWEPSVLAAATLTFDYGTLGTPLVTPLSASYLTSVTVTMSGEAGASIYYTIDGSEPTETSLLYTAPLAVTSQTTVNAKAFRVDYTPSATRSVPYWVQVAAPVITPAAGAYTAGTLVNATSATPGARVHYTTDGREPTTADPYVSASAPLYVGDFTLKARAFVNGADASDVASSTFALTSDLSLGTVAAGDTHSIALLPDGSVLGWGYNGAQRRLGVVYCSSFGVLSSDRPIASEVTAIKALDASYTATAAVRYDGQVVTWGANDYQQLGHEVPSATCTSLETADRPTARDVPGLTDIVAIDGGVFHFLALKADGSVWGWGLNQNGQLGNDATTDTAMPVQAQGLTGVTQISAGHTHSLAITSDGTLWSWGSNNFGQLGLTCCGQQLTPVPVSGITSPKAIAAGWNTSYAVAADGTIWIWGVIPSGLVPGAPPSSSTPLPVPGLTAIKSITTGASATYALGDDGRIWSWGLNTHGQLGDDTTTSRTVPGLVPGLPAIRSMAASADHALAVAADGSIWAWGRNASGEVGDLMTGTDRLTPMVVMPGDVLTPVTMTNTGTLNPNWDDVKYYHTDAIGSVRVITNRHQVVEQRFDYTPFGTLWNSDGTGDQPRRFTGQERDAETGLEYFGARYYASDNGRFTTVDPEMGIDAALLNPQRWNRYTYVSSNPFRFIDPDGRDPRVISAVIGAGIYAAWNAYVNVQQGHPWYQNIGVEATRGLLVGVTLGLAAPALATASFADVGIATTASGGSAAIERALRSADAAVRFEGQTGQFLAERNLLKAFNVNIGGRQIDAIAGEARNFVVEMTTGQGGGKLAQAAAQARATGLEVIIYGRNLSQGFVKEALRQGYRVARSPEELEKLLR